MKAIIKSGEEEVAVYDLTQLGDLTTYFDRNGTNYELEFVTTDGGTDGN